MSNYITCPFFLTDEIKTIAFICLIAKVSRNKNNISNFLFFFSNFRQMLTNSLNLRRVLAQLVEKNRLLPEQTFLEPTNTKLLRQTDEDVANAQASRLWSCFCRAATLPLARHAPPPWQSVTSAMKRSTGETESTQPNGRLCSLTRMKTRCRAEMLSLWSAAPAYDFQLP